MQNTSMFDRPATELMTPGIEEKTGQPLSDDIRGRLDAGMDSLKSRAQTIPQLIDKSLFYFSNRPLYYNDNACKILDDDGKSRLTSLLPKLAAAEDWTQDSLEELVKSYAAEINEKLGKIAQPLRAALTGTNVSPSIEIAATSDKIPGRIEDAILV